MARKYQHVSNYEKGIRDLYDSIVTYKMDKGQSAKLVLDTIKAAKRK